MSKQLVILGVFIFAQVAKPQIYPGGNHAFEKLSWGQSLTEARAIVKHASIREMESFKGGPFPKSPSKMKSYIFDDTLFGKKMLVTLSFDLELQHLSSMMVGYMWLDKKRGEDESPDVWNMLREYYGVPLKEKKIPAYGTSMSWKIVGTDVMAMLISSQITMLMIYFSAPE
jgi:hypothetical protein